MSIVNNESNLEDNGRREEFLTFDLGDESYAIDILNVQEIRSFEPPTHFANAPAFIMGVINLRGTIVPIVDMRIKFGTQVVDYTPFTVVIILNLGHRQVGIIVDAVSDVVGLTQSQIRPAPPFGAAVDISYVRGVASLDKRMLIVVNIEKLMSASDMALVNSAAESLSTS